MFIASIILFLAIYIAIGVLVVMRLQKVYVFFDSNSSTMAWGLFPMAWPFFLIGLVAYYIFSSPRLLGRLLKKRVVSQSYSKETIIKAWKRGLIKINGKSYNPHDYLPEVVESFGCTKCIFTRKSENKFYRGFVIKRLGSHLERRHRAEFVLCVLSED